jgi:7-cyano-7-deazaguanine synthase
MLSLLASYIAGRHLDAQSSEPEFHCVNILIYWGAHAEDAAGGAYPDCTVEFVGAMACAIDIGTAHFVRLVAPFVAMSKAEVVAYGASLGVPYDLTWSCYRGGDLHCGTCPTCRARRAAFRNGGVIDPTKYDA